MNDLSELSDEELLKLTEPLMDNDERVITCQKCGKEVVIKKHQKATKYCDECAEEERAHHYKKPKLQNPKPHWKTGTLGEHWKLEHIL